VPPGYFTCLIPDSHSHAVTGAVKVAAYPSGQWAGSVVAADSGVSTDPTWADHLRAAV
jgi:hypothetical protein